MKTARIKYQDDEYNLKIEVHEARVIDGYKRQVLLSNVITQTPQITPDTPITDTAMYILKAFTHPNVVAGTRKITNLKGAKIKLPESAEKIAFESLIELPERLIRLWEDAIIELNPHWVPRVDLGSQTVEDEDEEESEETREEKKDVEIAKSS